MSAVTRWRAAALAGFLALAGAGCVKTGTACAQLARANTGYACKHCNCLMPAGIAPTAACPTCRCGYAAAQCRRGA